MNSIKWWNLCGPHTLVNALTSCQYVKSTAQNCQRRMHILGAIWTPHASQCTHITSVCQSNCFLKPSQHISQVKWIKGLLSFLFSICQVLTNGRYKSVEHRAVTHKEKDRLSIVTFYAPSYEVELGPMPELMDENNPCKYRRYNHGEYSKHYVTNKLQGKKTLEFAKIHTKKSS